MCCCCFVVVSGHKPEISDSVCWRRSKRAINDFQLNLIFLVLWVLVYVVTSSLFTPGAAPRRSVWLHTRVLFMKWNDSRSINVWFWNMIHFSLTVWLLATFLLLNKFPSMQQSLFLYWKIWFQCCCCSVRPHVWIKLVPSTATCCAPAELLLYVRDFDLIISLFTSVNSDIFKPSLLILMQEWRLLADDQTPAVVNKMLKSPS